jgi:hypothetical protein
VPCRSKFSTLSLIATVIRFFITKLGVLPPANPFNHHTARTSAAQHTTPLLTFRNVKFSTSFSMVMAPHFLLQYPHVSCIFFVLASPVFDQPIMHVSRILPFINVKQGSKRDCLAVLLPEINVLHASCT